MAILPTLACIVCLEAQPESAKILNELCSKIVEKLNIVAPEQHWKEGHLICCKCEILLEYALEFKNLCVKFESHRTSLAKYENIDTDCEIAANCDSPAQSIKHFQDEDVAVYKTASDHFECHHCKRVYKVQEKLILHIASRHGLVCEHCNESFPTKKSLYRHMQSRHKEIVAAQRKKPPDKFFCELCGEKFALKKLILQHYVSAHSIDQKGAKPYSCLLCGSRFASSANLIQHKSYHEISRTHICSFCGKTFKTKGDLSTHESIHYNERKHKCQSCEKTFNTNKNLRTHILVVHTDPSLWKYSCPECLKRFPQKSNFDDHLKRHRNSRNFSCHICKKAFISRTELKRHLKLHSNERDYKCNDCDKEYKDKRSMDIHLTRIHAPHLVNVKKFSCHVCSSQFFEKYKLARHIRTHTGVKPFACDSCEKRFVDKSYLNHHFRTVHNTNEVQMEQFAN